MKWTVGVVMVLGLMVSGAAEAQIVTIPAPNGDQGFAPFFEADISPVTQGMEFDLRLVEADPLRPGKEILLFLITLHQVSVGRWHPTKHGVGGIFAGPGLCMENWTSLDMAVGEWNFNTHGDATGDGIDDWVLYLQTGSVKVYPGRGLNVCR